MINHIRTLLMNVTGDVSGYIYGLGEELIDPSFVSQFLSTKLQSVDNVLFGINPDRAMLCYRLRQYMTLLHSTELSEFVISFDPRITYWPIIDQTLFRTSSFGPAAEQVNTPLRTLSFVGNTNITDGSTLLQKWQVTITDASNVTITKLTHPNTTTIIPYTITNNLSNAIQLPGSSISFIFQDGIGSEWIIQSLARPLLEISDVINLLMNLDYVNNEEIFNGGTVEPYKTFSNLWLTHPEAPYKLGGLLLAYAYQLNSLLQGS